MLLLDGVYTGGHAAQAKQPRFQRVKAVGCKKSNEQYDIVIKQYYG